MKKECANIAISPFAILLITTEWRSISNQSSVKTVKRRKETNEEIDHQDMIINYYQN
jgi:hypothetical protein